MKALRVIQPTASKHWRWYPKSCIHTHTRTHTHTHTKFYSHFPDKPPWFSDSIGAYPEQSSWNRPNLSMFLWHNPTRFFWDTPLIPQPPSRYTASSNVHHLYIQHVQTIVICHSQSTSWIVPHNRYYRNKQHHGQTDGRTYRQMTINVVYWIKKWLICTLPITDVDWLIKSAYLK